jgi:hypothetical protein
MSRLFIYYNGRARDPTLAQNLEVDNGCFITDAIESLQQFGTCDENNWPFREEAIPLKPHDRAYQEAQKYTILEYNDVKVDLYQMKACLAQGFPFIFGLELFKSFGESEHNGGIVRYPAENETAADNHAMFVFS